MGEACLQGRLASSIPAEGWGPVGGIGAQSRMVHLGWIRASPRTVPCGERVAEQSDWRQERGRAGWSRQSHRKWSDPGYILKGKPTGFAHGLDTKVRRRGTEAWGLEQWKGVTIN